MQQVTSVRVFAAKQPTISACSALPQRPYSWCARPRRQSKPAEVLDGEGGAGAGGPCHIYPPRQRGQRLQQAAAAGWRGGCYPVLGAQLHALCELSHATARGAGGEKEVLNGPEGRRNEAATRGEISCFGTGTGYLEEGTPCRLIILPVQEQLVMICLRWLILLAQRIERHAHRAQHGAKSFHKQVGNGGG